MDSLFGFVARRCQRAVLTPKTNIGTHRRVPEAASSAPTGYNTCDRTTHAGSPQPFSFHTERRPRQRSPGLIPPGLSGYNRHRATSTHCSIPVLVFDGLSLRKPCPSRAPEGHKWTCLLGEGRLTPVVHLAREHVDTTTATAVLENVRGRLIYTTIQSFIKGRVHCLAVCNNPYVAVRLGQARAILRMTLSMEALVWHNVTIEMLLSTIHRSGRMCPPSWPHTSRIPTLWLSPSGIRENRVCLQLPSGWPRFPRHQAYTPWRRCWVSSGRAFPMCSVTRPMLV